MEQCSHSSQNFIDSNLPNDIFLNIFLYFNSNTLARVSTVSKRFCKTAVLSAFCKDRLNMYSKPRRILNIEDGCTQIKQLWNLEQTFKWTCIDCISIAVIHSAIAERDQNHKMTSEAIQFYYIALEINPYHDYAMYELSRLLIKTKSGYNEAEALLRKCLEIDPDNCKYLNDLADVIMQKRNRSAYDEAEMLYRKCLEIDPDNYDYMHNLANLLQEKRKPCGYNEAEILLRRCIENIPNNWMSMFNLAHLLMRNSNRYSEAETLFRKCLEIYKGYNPEPVKESDIKFISRVNKGINKAINSRT